ncbi:hypothetical protein [Geoglobus acetivorans]|uniref:Cytochrome c3 family protein n=1 Tax=Geoglobus acetivorans TaxID=565033 RepID=A0ABZ3H4E6_GEOAI|nr:hypothetical protein [Geoglobus acetivorans]
MVLKRLFIIVLIAATSLAMVNTVSLFVGQHYFYDLSSGYNEKCLKCHADIYDEMLFTPHHRLVDGQPGLNGDECYVCHRSEDIQYGNATTPGKEAHSASIMYCGNCHLNSTIAARYNAPLADDIYSTNEVHKMLAFHSALDFPVTGSNLLRKESEACIACHADVRVNITFVSDNETTITVSNLDRGGYSSYSVDNVVISEFKQWSVEK